MAHPASPPSSNGLGLSSNGDHLRAMDGRHDAASEPKPKAADDKGRVAYGPGFYVPPPGYPASTFMLGNAVGKVDEMVEIEMPATSSKPDTTDAPSFQPDGSSQAVGFATPPLRLKGGARSRSQTQRSRIENCRYTGDRARISSQSTYRASTIWPLLALLLAASQSMLLSTYERKQNAASIAVGFAALYLHLSAALLSTIGLLIVTNHVAFDRGDLDRKVKRRRKSSGMISVTNSLPNASGILVCLGSTLQLTAVVVSAFQAAEEWTIWSVVTAIVLSLFIALTMIVRQLYLDGHLRSTTPRSSSRDTEAGSRLPLSNPRSPSRSSSTSSHSGKYIPDYGLDCDSESDDDASAKNPRADWTDRVLDGLIHSPLLDEPKMHH